MTTLIVGAGEMGRWFGDVVGGSLAFADVDAEAAEAAAVAARERGLDARPVPVDGDEAFDVVCVAVPLSAAAEAVERHAPRTREAVVDVTGAMGPPLAAMERAAPDRERMSLHPLFAAANAPGNVAVVTAVDGSETRAVREAIEAAGNELVDVSAAEHDDAMRTVQGQAHAAVLAFALAAGGSEIPEGLSTPIYEELTALVEQVTGNTPRVYADIQAAFDGAADVAEAAERLAAADHAEFAALYEDAGR